MRRGQPLQRDAFNERNVVCYDIETVVVEGDEPADGSFPPWPRHQPVARGSGSPLSAYEAWAPGEFSPPAPPSHRPTRSVRAEWAHFPQVTPQALREQPAHHRPPNSPHQQAQWCPPD